MYGFEDLKYTFAREDYVQVNAGQAVSFPLSG